MAFLQNPVQAVPSEAAATHQEREHEGRRGGVRHVGERASANGLTLTEERADTGDQSRAAR
jgi:hypothetical protein